MEAYKKEFIDFMVDCGVLTFGDFITKSGRRTPYFINTGNYRTGAQMSRLGFYYAKCISEVLGDDFDILFGPAYKGIPLSVAAASALYQNFGLDKGFCFNRKEVKDHGEGGSLIGDKPVSGSRIVIIEDVMTAGTSVRETVPMLLASADGVRIEYEIISVDRMEVGLNGRTAKDEIREEFGISVHSIVNVSEIVEHMRGRIDVAPIEKYMEQYCEK